MIGPLGPEHEFEDEDWDEEEDELLGTDEEEVDFEEFDDFEDGGDF